MSGKSIPPPEVTQFDTKEIDEAITESDFLLRESKRRDFIRTERLRDMFGWVMVILTGLLGFIVILTVVILALHMLLPPHMGWLSTTQIIRIHTFLGGGVVGAILSAMIRYIEDRI